MKLGNSKYRLCYSVVQMVVQLLNEKFQDFDSQSLGILSGEPAGIRTRDPQLRRLLLYPAELPVRTFRDVIFLLRCKVNKIFLKCNIDFADMGKPIENIKKKNCNDMLFTRRVKI